MSPQALKEPAAKVRSGRQPVAKGRPAKSKAAAEPQADAAPKAPKTRARRATGQAKRNQGELGGLRKGPE